MAEHSFDLASVIGVVQVEVTQGQALLGERTQRLDRTVPDPAITRT
jgi:hypothetical protein